MDIEAAAAYADRHVPHALVVRRGEGVAWERYAGGHEREKPHPLYSGTKAFWGVLALAAQRDGLLDLDEPVARTVAAWGEDERKARVTLRELLQLTSGIGFGGLGNAVPAYDKALAVAIKDPPGSVFTYGGIPLQVFGAVLARKLAPRGLSPHDYLHERILDPIGMRVASWRTLKDGTQPLPTGAFVTAREWRTFGVLVRDGGTWEKKTIVPRAALARCFTGSDANPRYGLGWWLSPLAQHPDVVYASGAGGQAMYVVPSAGAVIVKFGGSASYKHDAFLKRLLG
jgi:CubicO group peptidase (beta-lactamase class C family)